MTAPSFPVLRLKPKADARRIRHGHPWAWADDLVLDRRSKAVPAGALALLEDAERQPIGIGVATVNARIGLRILDRAPDTVIDKDWLRAKINRAARLRDALYDAPYYRLIHAEGDGLPGLIVDRFGDTLVMQPNAIWLEERLDDLRDLLLEATGATTLIKNGTSRARALEDLPEEILTLAGTAPDGPIEVPMNGATYMADVMGGQKTGLFYDQRPNHALMARLAEGARVLDVFTHVGGFALATLAAGAQSALAVDASEPALTLAGQGAQAMGCDARFDTRQGDAFTVMEALAAEGATFDLVIADPPAFAPSKPALDKGLRAYERVARLAASLVAEGGTLMLCSCSHAADLGKFRASCIRGIGRAGREPRLIYTGFAGPDHPVHPSLSDTGYLKALAFSL
ncbi:RSP_2647 family RNA methyltransferase [Gymnodinialimonas ceratoperidinii]|uniref:Class I SAM-dependent rRNA methyltransferase n=1 Tax=Gymnodinialimonas ceratoperidinii TaxID=2856823 RepID=A0A8F6Y9P3_9RHOB|nr:class I SAM-dependent rRNA methyltransferase [Gymnodinialimonas ceratoperidinii]QXT38091.1 class I SAM-dependent rRNA methyltransferase [Gymnodinialimonas ceratoperidinii]